METWVRLPASVAAEDICWHGHTQVLISDNFGMALLAWYYWNVSEWASKGYQTLDTPVVSYHVVLQPVVCHSVWCCFVQASIALQHLLYGQICHQCQRGKLHTSTWPIWNYSMTCNKHCTSSSMWYGIATMWLTHGWQDSHTAQKKSFALAQCDFALGNNNEVLPAQ